jgi:hypothetical protein
LRPACAAFEEGDPPVIRVLCRVALVAPLLAVGLGATSSVARTGPAAPICAHAASAHRVGLVVEHGNGQVIRRCIGFDGSTITAVTVLQASGLEIGLDTYGSLGAAVCQIDHEPAGYTTCLPASGSYWVLFISHAGGAWITSATGASSTNVGGGDDVGFRFDPLGGADPPPPTAAGTCPPATPATAAPSSPASGRSPAPARTPSQPARATPSVAIGPTSGVLATTPTPGGALPRARAATAVASAAGAQVNVGLLAAVSAIGGLLGLLGAQALRRRRR